MADVLDEIAREVQDNKVVIYMKGTPSFPMCGFSAATVQVLREVGVPFKAVDVLAEPEKRDAVKRFSNWPTIPQVYVGGKFIGGCDIVREMHARGELVRGEPRHHAPRIGPLDREHRVAVDRVADLGVALARVLGAGEGQPDAPAVLRESEPGEDRRRAAVRRTLLVGKHESAAACGRCPERHVHPLVAR